MVYSSDSSDVRKNDQARTKHCETVWQQSIELIGLVGLGLGLGLPRYTHLQVTQVDLLALKYYKMGGAAWTTIGNYVE